jgi:hypothetical protein
MTGIRTKQNAAPNDANDARTSSSGPSAQAQDLSFVLNNFKEIEKVRFNYKLGFSFL